MPQIRYIAVDRRPRSLLMQIIGFVVGVGILIVSVVLGAFLLAGLFGFGLLVALIVYIRVWWLGRKMTAARQEDDIIETEYQVIDTSERGSDRS